ncbi:MAG TPA: c-type cytochrome biogenesis protein CcmI [Stellaceae bacterium]|nr:c-type cytochrome biogenesis protein CcmI [Stellaceae bacterium]
MTIGLAAALAGLTGVALAILLVPLFRHRGGAASREDYNLAVYRDQLAEVERDLARGVLAAEQGEAARAEIARRILALKPAEAETGPGRVRVATIVAILMLPLAAGALYWRLGSPALPDQPFGGFAAANPPGAADLAHIGMDEALARLRAHLGEHPEDLTGWLLLGRSELSLGHYKEAAEAYRHAADLSGRRADIAGDWGEAQVLAAGGTVTAAAQKAFAAGLADPETAPRARYYLALARMQEGDVKGALQAWRDLAAEAPPGADWLPLVQQRMSEAARALGIDPATLNGTSNPGAPKAPGKAAAEAIAGAAPDERQAMITAMVERLAARLESEPDDVAGWARLGRSYMVLNEPEKARDAYARALKLKPDDPGLKAALAEANNAASGKPAPAAPAPDRLREPPSAQPSR